MTESISIENLLDKSGYSVYKLVVMASKRALDLAEGKPRLVEIPLGGQVKPSTLALREIAKGKVKVK